MSELSKLLQSKSTAANPANPANKQPEISKISNFSKQGYPKEAFGSRDKLRVPAGPDWSESPLVKSVDMRSKELRVNRDALHREAGDDWEEVSNDPAKLIAFADLLATSRIRESGGIPDTYTAITECKHCGTVPIWEGCPPKVNGCPWCLNRIKGLPMPSNEDIHSEGCTR